MILILLKESGRITTTIWVIIYQGRCSFNRWNFWKNMIHYLSPMKGLICKVNQQMDKNRLIIICKIIWIISMKDKEINPKKQIKTKIWLFLKTKGNNKIVILMILNHLKMILNLHKQRLLLIKKNKIN